MDLASIAGTLMDGMSGGVLGAVTGIFGAGVNAFIKHKKRKDDQAHEREMRKFDQDDMRLESELLMARDQATADAELKTEEMKAFKMSLKGADETVLKKEYMQDLWPWLKGIIALLMALVDVINKTVRPAITYYFLYQTHKILSKVMESSTFYTQVNPQTVVSVILYLAVTAATWWLGQRPMDKMMDKIIPA